MSVRRAQREIDSREFAEWMAMSQMDPFGDDRADWRQAREMASRDPEGRPVSEFLLRFEDPDAEPEVASSAELLRKMHGVKNAVEGRR